MYMHMTFKNDGRSANLVYSAAGMTSCGIKLTNVKGQG